MLESGQYIIRDFASDHYVGRSTFEENNWDPKIIYDLDDLEVLCSGYPLWDLQKSRKRGFRLLTENGVSAIHNGNLVALLVESPRLHGERWNIVPQPKFGQDVYTIEGKEGSLYWEVNKSSKSVNGIRINVASRQPEDRDRPSSDPPPNSLFIITAAPPEED